MFHRVLLLLFISVDTIAQVNSGARFTAMANTGTALQHVFSLSSNPAGIAGLKSTALGISAEDHFFGADIKTQTAVAVFPNRFGVLGYSLINYGIQNAYSDLKSGLSFARMFGPQLSMALTVNFHQLKVINYGSNHSFSTEFGLQYFLTPKWTLGAHVENPGSFTYENDLYANIPTFFRLGQSYRFSDQVILSMDAKYRLNEKVDGSLGLEYVMVDWLALRGGVSVNAFQQYAGFGFGYEGFFFDVAAIIHPRLGLSSQISLYYEF